MYRDDDTAAQAHADALEHELAETRRELDDTRTKLAAAEKALELARVSQWAAEGRRKKHHPPPRPPRRRFRLVIPADVRAVFLGIIAGLSATVITLSVFPRPSPPRPSPRCMLGSEPADGRPQYPPAFSAPPIEREGRHNLTVTLVDSSRR